MKVSVALPVYNKAPYLKEALDSIFAQTFTDFEVIAVDDKSTDESLAILRAVNDPRLKVVALETNLGHPGATQTAFALAQGEYIIRCDADDLFHPERFARQVAYMDARPEVGISGSGLQLFGDSREAWSYSADDDACKARLFFTPPVADGACIIRRVVLSEQGLGFRAEWPRVGADWLLMLTLAPVTRFGNLPENLLQYRRGEQNISAREKSMDARRECTRLSLQLLGFAGSPEEVEDHMTSLMYPMPRTPERVLRLYRWLRTLEQANVRLGRSKPATFQRETAAVWRRYFFTLEHAGLKTLWAYVRLNKGLPPDLAMYLLKVRVRRWLPGRKASVA